MRPKGWIGLCFLALAANACAPAAKPAKTAEQYQEEARVAYEEAVDAFLDQDWEVATRLFDRVRKDFSYTRYARLAELRLADASFRQEKYAEATVAYKTFAKDYPSDPEVPYARYRVVRAQFLQSGSSVFQPPLEERDLASVRGAYTSLQAFLADYPNYPRRVELDYMLQVVTGVLARHELYVARFYLKRDQYPPAIERVRYALDRYKNSGLEPEAVTLMGETYLKMKDQKQAAAAFERVLKEYPASPFAVPARRFLARLEQEPQSSAPSSASPGSGAAPAGAPQ
ncbi:MAG TPA: outer membrane protein assembly factor BamD [Polyangiaceae bacterium]|jgi:outer membrane protein assembly factor BamD|nr:outer membrane protein assembly factor BamD [Polyangiaceae bacterium]